MGGGTTVGVYRIFYSAGHFSSIFRGLVYSGLQFNRGALKFNRGRKFAYAERIRLYLV